MARGAGGRLDDGSRRGVGGTPAAGWEGSGNRAGDANSCRRGSEGVTDDGARTQAAATARQAFEGRVSPPEGFGRGRLTRLGLRKSHLELSLGDPSITANYVEMRRITSELADIEQALAAAEDAWLEVEERAP